MGSVERGIIYRGWTPEKARIIVSQYGLVGGALNVMFKEISIRSEEMSWRDPNPKFPFIPKEGIGSCSIDKELSEEDIIGPARSELIVARENLRDKTRNTDSSVCPYHEKNGCCLAGLKSPLCFEYMENDSELTRRFSIDGYALGVKIRGILKRVLLGGTNPLEEDSNVKPEVNNDFVRKQVEGIAEITEYIKTFPVLHPEEDNN